MFECLLHTEFTFIPFSMPSVYRTQTKHLAIHSVVISTELVFQLVDQLLVYFDFLEAFTLQPVQCRYIHRNASGVIEYFLDALVFHADSPRR